MAFFPLSASFLRFCYLALLGVKNRLYSLSRDLRLKYRQLQFGNPLLETAQGRR
jgi:hypothetical protein